MVKWFKSAKKDEKPVRVEPVLSSSPEKKAHRWTQSDVRSIERSGLSSKEKPNAFERYTSPLDQHIFGSDSPQVAMDACYDGQASNYAAYYDMLDDGTGFLGYPRLALMASSRAEYRHIASAMAEEATREWGEFYSQGDKDKSERIKQLEKEFERLNVRSVIAQALEYNDIFGIGQIFIDMGYDPKDERNGNPLLIGPETIRKGSIKSLNPIEPVWTTPNQYNSAEALRRDFYKPTQWWVMGANVHSSRLLRFVSREVSDLLKPSYNFGGTPLVQVAKPYVDNWVRTRQSVSDLINGCSIVSLRTNMEATVQSGGIDGLISRIEAFTRTRSNRGVFLTDKETEELQILSANLAGLGELQNQALEQICVVAQIPLVKFSGIQPSGLNASSDGEIRVWYDHVSSVQERVVLPNIKKIMHLAMLNIWGEIDHDIQFRFIPLWQMDEAQKATVEKSRADTRAVYVEMGVASADEARKALANDDDSPFSGADMSGDAYPPMTPEDEEGLRRIKTFGNE